MQLERRQYLAFISFATVGTGSGCSQLTTPKTETKIGSHHLSGTVFDRLDFYKSGGAEVWFREHHGGDKFGITHSNLQLPDDAYGTWSTPDFRGPVVIDLKSIVSNNGPYPNRES